MPRTRTQRIVFSILMAFAMVYGMELYNQALLAGGLRTELFAAPPADIVPLMATVIVLETLVGGRVAGRLVGRLLDAERCPQASSWPPGSRPSRSTSPWRCSGSSSWRARPCAPRCARWVLPRVA